MSYLVDTNVLVRLVQPKKPDHTAADRALRSLQRQRESLGITPQNLIEFWAVATRPAVNNGLDMTVEERPANLPSKSCIHTTLFGGLSR